MNSNNKEEIKNNLNKVLIYYGATPGITDKNNWDCIPGRHGDSKGDLSVKNIVCSCHCGLQGDVFNVIAEMENLDVRKDFFKVVKRGNEILNLPVNTPILTGNKSKDSNYKSINESKEVEIKEEFDLTNIINHNYKKLNRYEAKYFIDRGFDLDLINHYKVIIKDPAKVFPVELLPCNEKSKKYMYKYKYIIPVWKNGKVVNCILRKYTNDNFGKKTLNLKLGVELFNYDYLNRNNLDYLFICEGWADALSFTNERKYSIALNSITMYKRFVKEIEGNIERFKNTKFFICFDQDEKGWGQLYAKKLLKELKILNLSCKNLIVKDYKDINDFYISDKVKFLESVRRILIK